MPEEILEGHIRNQNEDGAGERGRKTDVVIRWHLNVYLCYIISIFEPSVYVLPDEKYNKIIKYHKISTTSSSDLVAKSAVLEMPLYFSEFLDSLVFDHLAVTESVSLATYAWQNICLLFPTALYVT